MKEGRRSFLKMLGIGAATAPVVATGIALTVNEAQGKFGRSLPEGFKDPYYIPSEAIPPGMIYNWKRTFIDAATHDIEHYNAMIYAGWRPVPRLRHPDLFKGSGGNYWIEVGGLVLMERPVGQLNPSRYPRDINARLKHEGTTVRYD